MKYARERFWEQGFSKVTMDELAYNLGISKKTLYVHFPNKRALLRESLLNNLKEIETGLQKILNSDNQDFAVRLREVFTYLKQVLPKPGPVFFTDMQRFTNDVWQEIDRERLRILREHFEVFFETGVQIGVLRPDLECKTLISILLTLVQQMVNPDTLLLTSKSPAEALEEVFDVVFIGILTENGRKGYQKIIAGE
jgi:AcrR family transcriptional regulator